MRIRTLNSDEVPEVNLLPRLVNIIDERSEKRIGGILSVLSDIIIKNLRKEWKRKGYNRRFGKGRIIATNIEEVLIPES